MQEFRLRQSGVALLSPVDELLLCRAVLQVLVQPLLVGDCGVGLGRAGVGRGVVVACVDLIVGGEREEGLD